MAWHRRLKRLVVVGGSGVLHRPLAMTLTTCLLLTLLTPITHAAATDSAQHFPNESENRAEEGINKSLEEIISGEVIGDRKERALTWGHVLSNSPSTYFEPQPATFNQHPFSSNLQSYLPSLPDRSKSRQINPQYSNHQEAGSSRSNSQHTSSSPQSHDDEVYDQLAKYLMGHQNEAWLPVRSVEDSSSEKFTTNRKSNQKRNNNRKGAPQPEAPNVQISGEHKLHSLLDKITKIVDLLPKTLKSQEIQTKSDMSIQNDDLRDDDLHENDYVSYEDNTNNHKQENVDYYYEDQSYHDTTTTTMSPTTKIRESYKGRVRTRQFQTRPKVRVNTYKFDQAPQLSKKKPIQTHLENSSEGLQNEGKSDSKNNEKESEMNHKRANFYEQFKRLITTSTPKSPIYETTTEFHPTLSPKKSVLEKSKTSYEKPFFFTSNPIFTTDDGESASYQNNVVTTTQSPAMNKNTAREKLKSSLQKYISSSSDQNSIHAHSKVLFQKIIQRLRHKSNSDYDESFFANHDYEYVDTSDPGFNSSILNEGDEDYTKIKQKAQRRTLDLLYHMFIDPTTDENGNRRNTLIEDLIRAFDEHIVADVQAYRNHKKSGKEGQSHFRENNGDFFRTLMESVGLDQNFMQSTADLFNDASVDINSGSQTTPRSRPRARRPTVIQSQPKAKTPKVQTLPSGDEFVLTDGNGDNRVVTIDDIIGSLSAMDEDEALDLLFGNQIRRSDEETDSQIYEHAYEMENVIESEHTHSHGIDNSDLHKISNDNKHESQNNDGIKVNNLIVLDNYGTPNSIPINSFMDSSGQFIPHNLPRATTSSPTEIAAQFLLNKNKNQLHSFSEYSRPANPTMEAAHLLFGLTSAPKPVYFTKAPTTTTTTTTTPKPTTTTALPETSTKMPLILVRFGNQYIPVSKENLNKYNFNTNANVKQNPISLTKTNVGDSYNRVPFQPAPPIPTYLPPSESYNPPQSIGGNEEQQKHLQSMYEAADQLLKPAGKTQFNHPREKKNSNSQRRPQYNPVVSNHQELHQNDASKQMNKGNVELRKQLESLVEIRNRLNQQAVQQGSSSVFKRNPQNSNYQITPSKSKVRYHQPEEEPSQPMPSIKQSDFVLPPPLQQPSQETFTNDRNMILKQSRARDKQFNTFLRAALTQIRERSMEVSPTTTTMSPTTTTVRPTEAPSTESPYVLALRAIQKASNEKRKSHEFYHPNTALHQEKIKNEYLRDMLAREMENSRNTERYTSDNLAALNNINRRKDTIGDSSLLYQSVGATNSHEDIEKYIYSNRNQNTFPSPHGNANQHAYNTNGNTFQQHPNTANRNAPYNPSHNSNSYYQNERRSIGHSQLHDSNGIRNFAHKHIENNAPKESKGIASKILDNLKNALPKPIHYSKPTTGPSKSSQSSFFGFNIPNIFSSDHSHSHGEPEIDTKIDRSDDSDEIKWDDPLGILGLYDYLPFTKRTSSKERAKPTTEKPPSKEELLHNALRAGNVPDRVSKILVNQIKDKSKFTAPNGASYRNFNFNPSNSNLRTNSRADKRSSYHPPPHRPRPVHRPVRAPPKYGYGPPKPGYGPPKRDYGPPEPAYGGPPKPTFGYTYSAEYGPPSPDYHHPSSYADPVHTGDSEYDTYIVPIGHKKPVSRAQPMFDLSLLFNSVQVSKTGDKDGSFTLPNIGDPKRFVNIHRPTVGSRG